MRPDKRGEASPVDAVMESLDVQKREIAEKLRQIVKKSVPGVVETVKWRNVTYLAEGKNLAWLLIYKDHIDLGFFLGAKLKSKRLEGTGKGLRHIKVRTLSDIDEPEFAKLLKQSYRML